MSNELKAAILVLVGLVTTILIMAAWPGDGGGEDCYPPVDSGQPESAREHGLVSEECK